MYFVQSHLLPDVFIFYKNDYTYAGDVLFDAVKTLYQNPEMIEKAKAELKTRLQDNSYKCLIPKDVLPHISNVE